MNERTMPPARPPAGAAESVKVRDAVEFPWEQSPGHFDGAYSKILANADFAGGGNLDFRMSTYLPKAYVQRHAHADKQQIYFFLEGEGILELNDEKTIVRRNQFAFIPPHVPHALVNTGTSNLVFLVVTNRIPASA